MPLWHNGISAWIMSDGIYLQELAIMVDPDTNTVSCVIAGIPGRRFAVWWTSHDASYSTATFITLDGVRVPGKILQGAGTACRDGGRVSGNTQRPFLFKESVDTGSSDVLADDGMITLKVKRVKLLCTEKHKNPKPLPSNRVLGKRKAVGSFHVGFGEEEPTPPRQGTLTWKLAPLEDDTSPGWRPRTFVTFIFKYRPLEYLCARDLFHGPTQSMEPVQVPNHPTEHSLVESTTDAPAAKRRKLQHSPTASESSHVEPINENPSFTPSPPSHTPMASISLSRITPINILPSQTSHIPIVSTSLQQPLDVDYYPTQSESQGEGISEMPAVSNQSPLPPDDPTKIVDRLYQEMVKTLPPDFMENPLYAKLVQLFHPPTGSANSRVEASMSRRPSKGHIYDAPKSRTASASGPSMATTSSEPQSAESEIIWKTNPTFSPTPMGFLDFQGFTDDSNTPDSA